jgi:hypothetical protein
MTTSIFIYAVTDTKKQFHIYTFSFTDDVIKIGHCLTSAITENHATVVMLIHQSLMKEWHGSGQGETVNEDFKVL